MALLVTPYSVTTDFGGGPVNIDVLRREIIADATITQTPNYIIIEGDVVDMDFTTPLSAGEITALDAIVAAHPSITIYNGEQRKVYTASTPPTVNEDADDSFDIGDMWVDTNSDKSYIVTDTTSGAAVWKLLAPEAGAVTTSSVDPTVNDDVDLGFSVGDIWVNTTTGIAYITTDNTDGAAVWRPITPDVMGGFIVDGADLTITTHNNTNFVEKLSVSTGSIPAGDYVLHYSYKWNIDSTAQNFEAQIQQNNTTVVHSHVEEATDSTGDYANTGSDQKMPTSGFITLTLGAGTYTFDLDFKAPTAQVAVSMWDARIYIQRVSF